MRDYGRGEDSGSFDMEVFFQMVRLLGAIVGIVIIIVGFAFAVGIYRRIAATLGAPGGFKEVLEEWIRIVGGNDLNLVVGEKEFHCANILGVLILGGGGLVLAWIAMGLILTGAKVASWMLSDREAIKRLLQHAFGPSKMPRPTTSSTAIRPPSSRILGSPDRESDSQ